MRKIKLSLKYKILLLLLVIPLLSLLIYILMISKFFERDKIAYVYDATLLVAKNQSSQLKSEIELLKEQIKGVAQGFHVQDKYFVRLSKELFFQNNSIKSVYMFTGNEFKLESSLIKSNQNIENLEKDLYLDILKKAQEELKKEPFYLYFSEENNKLKSLIFVFKVKISEVEFLVLSELNPVLPLNSISNQKTYDTYYLFSENKILNAQGEIKNINEHFMDDEKLNSVLNGSSILTAIEMNSTHKEHYIGAYSKLGIGKLAVITVIKKSKALDAIVLLWRKSIVFFIALISFGFILSFFAASKLTSAFQMLYEASHEIGKGNFNIKVNVSSNDEVGILADTFNIMAQQISSFVKERIEKVRMEKELETAHIVQRTLMPQSDRHIKNLNISGHFESASECGGDWWCYYELDQKIYTCIADVTGHGVPAALVTSATHAAFTLFKELKITDLKNVVRLMNEAVFEATKGELTMTFFISCFNPNTLKLEYCNASHEPPFWITPSKEFNVNSIKFLSNPINERLGSKSYQNEKIQLIQELGEVQLTKGDLLFFYTDGLMDIQNNQGESYGKRKLQRFIAQLVQKRINLNNSEKISDQFFKNELLKELNNYRDGSSLLDDVTFFTLEVKDS